jgi:hypothetical protein
MQNKELNPNQSTAPEEPSDWDKLTNLNPDAQEFTPSFEAPNNSSAETSPDDTPAQIGPDGTIIREQSSSEESEN